MPRHSQFKRFFNRLIHFFLVSRGFTTHFTKIWPVDRVDFSIGFYK